MGAIRSVLLKASESAWLAARLPNYPFARKAVRRFMPGESEQDAFRECAVLRDFGLATVVTRLGENVSDPGEADAVGEHYLEVITQIRERSLPTHVSVKLTHLGLDVRGYNTARSLNALMEASAPAPVWIDMESSRYTDATIAQFRTARATGTNVGLCLQSYLRRTKTDLDALLPTTTAIRLVKGAYKEPSDSAFARKADVDANFLECAHMLLQRAKEEVIGHAPAFATHDMAIIRNIAALATANGVARDRFEFQLLYGIKPQEQQRLVREGFRVRVLISYGAAWFAWYMRRLAERPANVVFVLKNLF